jgi:hypothetical protein
MNGRESRIEILPPEVLEPIRRQFGVAHRAKARAPLVQPPQQRKAEPVPTRWRSLSAPRGLVTAYAMATKCRNASPNASRMSLCKEKAPRKRRG